MKDNKILLTMVGGEGQEGSVNSAVVVAWILPSTSDLMKMEASEAFGLNWGTLQS